MELVVARATLVLFVAFSCAELANAQKKRGQNVMSDTPSRPPLVPPSPWAWGPVNAEGLSIAFVPAAATLKVGQPLQYRVAFANRSRVPLRVVLFSTLEGKFRTRVVLRDRDGQEQLHAAIAPSEPVSGPFIITVTLSPGEELLRDGAAVVPRGLGALSARVDWGGPPATLSELHSALVPVTIAP